MKRLTIKSGQYESHYVLKCNCTIGADGKVDSEDGCIEYCELHGGDCEDCKIQEAFDRLAAYEDTGLTPEEVEALKIDNDRLHKLLDEIEEVVIAKPKEPSSEKRVHCKDSDYLNILQTDNAKLHKLIDELENGLRKESNNA